MPSHTPLAPTDGAELPAASHGPPPSLAADQPSRWGPGEYALLSALLPGAGQVAQRRWGTAAVQAVTVVSYLVGALALGGGDRALWLAFAWNVWSAIDAYRHAPD